MSCSIIYAEEEGAVFFRAIKYPLTHADTAINGREKDKILRDGAALKSEISVLTINSEPKYTTDAEAKAMVRLTTMHHLKIFSIPFRLPNATSSETRRVTAIPRPDVAKVETRT